MTTQMSFSINAAAQRGHIINQEVTIKGGSEDFTEKNVDLILAAIAKVSRAQSEQNRRMNQVADSVDEQLLKNTAERVESASKAFFEVCQQTGLTADL